MCAGLSGFEPVGLHLKRGQTSGLMLVGCALRRNELAEVEVEAIQQREGRWVLADLEGKGRRIRTVAVPIWVKQGIEAWTAGGRGQQRGAVAIGVEVRQSKQGQPERLGRLVGS
jgi:integrase